MALRIELVREATSADERAFRAAIRKATRDWEAFLRQSYVQIDDMLREFREDVLADIAGATEWSEHHADEVARAIDASRERLNRRLNSYLVARSTEATALAIAGVDAPLAVAGVLASGVAVQLSERQIAAFSTYQFTLIKDVTAEIRKKVQTLTLQSMMGGIPRKNVVAELGRLVGSLRPGPRPAGTVFSGAQVRARNILRTEMNRLHNIVTKQRIKSVSDVFPAVGKRWVHRPSPSPRPEHLALHGKIVYPAKGEKFELAGMEIDGPHDPQLPVDQVINCHCLLVVEFNPADRDRGTVQSDPLLSTAR